MSDLTPTPSEPVDPPTPTGQRTRLVLVVVAVLVAIGLAVGGVLIATHGDDDDTGGAAPAPCGSVISRETDRTQQHTNDEDVDYADAPPSFGAHFPQWEPFGRAFYGDDRPPVSHLVHNLEHGYTIAWYDETIAEDDDAMDDLADIAQDYQDEQERFIAVPWRSSDGDDFPKGMHVALTRWSADPADPADLDAQRGNWLYCGGVEADAIDDFVEAFPNERSPEPGIPLE